MVNDGRGGGAEGGWRTARPMSVSGSSHARVKLSLHLLGEVSSYPFNSDANCMTVTEIGQLHNEIKSKRYDT